jgi:NADH-quinone oxidoreductase subunit L
MIWQLKYLWLIPALPLLAAGLLAVTKRPQRGWAAGAAIGAMGAAFFLSCAAFAATLRAPAEPGSVWRGVYNFDWFDLGTETLRLGWVLDPLTAVMLMMVSFVGLLIFIYSIGYMAEDENFTRFFCFLSLFAAAMLGLVMANSLLLLFICWELVGVASFLLIGFWYYKPSAAAAAQKAFITTRIGDIGLFLGMLWLFSETGTLLFYDGGDGCLEPGALADLGGRSTMLGISVAAAISLLIFCGAVGKSGQVPLHVWLPDAMEGPTPVSALIHAATMVAAGVFLVARVFPLMGAVPEGVGISSALVVVTWVGAVTAVFAASIAVAQTEIKRILAYSTVSQLGYMMMGLGVGGIAVGMFHLITHAFFKALLFLGAGSVIHGAHGEQDIRRMGGLKKYMPVTFATYAIGMMALAGVPLFFSGFWSKDEILHAAQGWEISKGPFVLGLIGAVLTAFYMTRQVLYVFFGENRREVPLREAPADVELPPEGITSSAAGRERGRVKGKGGRGGALAVAARHEELHPHESPRVMTAPLMILAVFAVLLGFLGTPVWPGFQSYLTGEELRFAPGRLFQWGVLSLILISTVLVAGGIGLGWWLYGRKPVRHADDPDALERVSPGGYGVLREKFYVDEFYARSVVRFQFWSAAVSDWLDRRVWGGAVELVGSAVLAVSWVNRLVDEYVVKFGFDLGCRGVRNGGRWVRRMQGGQVQNYLRGLGLALAVLILFLLWGCR